MSEDKIDFSEAKFKNQVNSCLEELKKILEVQRQPKLPEEVTHKYDDKFALAESLTNTALAAEVVVLGQLGVNLNILKELLKWSENRTITLRFQGQEVRSSFGFLGFHFLSRFRNHLHPFPPGW